MQTLASQTTEQITFSNFLHTSTRPTDKALVQDELQIYLSELVLSLATEQETHDFRALDWWTQGLQKTRFPRLSRMAFDILTVPTMSAEIERVFSECSLTLDHQ